MTIGERIRNARKQKGLTQKQLGELARIAEPTIRRYELGKLNPKVKTIQRIADALGINALDLMGIGDELERYTYEITDIKPLHGFTQQEEAEERKRLISFFEGKGWRDLYDELSDDEKKEFWAILTSGEHHPKEDASGKSSTEKPRITIVPNEKHLSEDAQKIAVRYSKLDTYGKAAVQAVMGEEEARIKEQAELDLILTKPEPKIIPLYLVPAAAGYASPIYGSEYENYELTPEDPQGAMFAIKVQGDSMEPYFPDGSIAFCNKDPIADGDIGVFCLDGDSFIKQYHYDRFMGMTYLFSLNRDRADADKLITKSTGQTLACMGRVITRRRYPLPGADDMFTR